MTIKDIAERCGVSVSTVSRVLNDHPDVSAANREKVMAVVRESGTEPLVRVMVEAESEDRCRELANRVVEVIRAQGHGA